MTTMTKSQQKNAVSEGFALGLCLLGHESLFFEGYTMSSVDLSIAQAWRSWSRRDTFPEVDKAFGPVGLNGNLVVRHAKSQRHATTVFYWDRYAWRTRGDWDFPEQADEAADMICGAVSAEEWVDLVKAFLDRLYSFGPGPDRG